MAQSEATAPPDADSTDQADVDQVRRNWRVLEDGGVAHVLQQAEFNQHFDQNRSERRNMQTDTRLCKEEQKLEDRFAEEYRFQVRLDLEKEDERLARELQEQLEIEENENKQMLLAQDERLARKLQASFNSSAQNGPALPCVQFDFPSVVPAQVCAVIQQAHDRSSPLNLPANLTIVQLEAIYDTIKEYNPRLAQEVKDYELALKLSHNSTQSGQQQVGPNVRHSRVGIDKQWINVIQREITKSSSSSPMSGDRRFSPQPTSGSSPTRDQPDLIEFDDENFGNSSIDRTPAYSADSAQRSLHVSLAGTSTSVQDVNEMSSPNYSKTNVQLPRLTAGRGESLHNIPLPPRSSSPGSGPVGYSNPPGSTANYGNASSAGCRGHGISSGYGSPNATCSPGGNTIPHSDRTPRSPSAYVNASGVTVIPRGDLQ